MVVYVPVYSEQDLTPRAAEVLRSITNSEFPHLDIKFRTYRGTDKRVLVFGRAPSARIDGVEYVYTYSVAQMMTKANASSVIRAGIQNVLSEPEPVPFSRPIGTTWAGDFGDGYFDFDKPVVIDIETDGNLGKTHTPEEVNIISVAIYQPGKFATGIVRYPVVLINSATWNAVGDRAPLDMYAIETLREILPKFKYAIYHNGKFDTRVLNRVLGVKLHVWFDTMLAHHVLNQAAGDHKLKTLARRYLGAPEWEADLGKYTKGGGHYERIPGSALIAYNGWDVYWTYKLYEFLAPQIAADENAQKALNFELAAADFLLDVEEYGIPIDMDYAHAFAEDLDTMAGWSLAAMRSLTGIPEFNPNSPKQVKEVLAKWGWFVDKTDEERLNEIIKAEPETKDVHIFAKTLLAYRKQVKTRSTYALGWSNKARHGRVHPTYLVHGTSTGRLSSTSPNAQNMPREKSIRKLVRTHG